MRLVLVAFLLASQLAAQSDVALPPEVYAARRARLAAQAADAVIIVPGKYLIGEHDLPKQDPNFWYLTGVESPYAVLVMAPGGRSLLFLPDSFQFAGAQFPMADSGFRRAMWNRAPWRLSPGASTARVTGMSEVHPVDSLLPRLAEIVAGATTIQLPLSDDSLFAPPGLARPLRTEQQFARSIALRFPRHALKDVTPAIRRLRLIKDEHEIAALRRAADISAQSMRTLMHAVQPGMNDLEAAGILESEWKRLGSPRAAFAPIVGSGPHSMTFFTVMGERYNAVDRQMMAGELLFVDYGAAEFRMYASDLCRTIPVSGRFTPVQRKYYDIVLEAQDSAIARVRPGVMMLDVIKAAAAVFRRHGLERYEDVERIGPDRVWGIMPSPTHYLARNAGITAYSRYGAGVRDIGHHVGLDATDSRDWSVPLAPGMVITIEPKLYIPELQIAIMIEDMIVVTARGYNNLSLGAPKRAAEIEALMRPR